MSNQSTVSVIIPAFNQAAYLSNALQSILRQTYIHWEAIVVDDASTDPTPQVVASFSDPRIRYFRNGQNQERSQTRNIGIKNAQGDFIAFLDADDFWAPTFLEKQIKLLNEHPQAGLGYSGYYDTTPLGQPVRSKTFGQPGLQERDHFLRSMLSACRISTGAIVLRSEVLQKVGAFDPRLRQGEDWDLWLRVAEKFQVAAIAEPLLYYRRYNNFMPKRMTSRNVESAYLDILDRAFKRLNAPYFEMLKPRVLAETYWRMAWMQYALGNPVNGQSHMTIAKQYDPALFTPPYERLVESIGYLADELYDLTTPVEEAVACVNRLFDNLPDWAGAFGKFRSRVLGQVCGVAAFSAYQRGDVPELKRSLRPALLNHPTWIFNRGFASMVVQVLRGTVPRMNSPAHHELKA